MPPTFDLLPLVFPGFVFFKDNVQHLDRKDSSSTIKHGINDVKVMMLFEVVVCLEITLMIRFFYYFATLDDLVAWMNEEEESWIFVVVPTAKIIFTKNFRKLTLMFWLLYNITNTWCVRKMGIVIYEVEKRDSFRSHLSTLLTARIINWGNLLRKVDRKGY